MSKENPSTLSTVSTIIALTLLGKIMGLWRDRMLALAYGTGMEANAFYTASRIPRVFFDSIFASAIAVCLIPVFSRCESDEGKEKANLFGGNFISVMGGLTALLTVLGMAFAPSMVAVFAGGYDAETQTLAVSLTQMMFPTVFFTGLAFSFVGILQAREHFIIPAVMSCLSNGVIILYFYVWNKNYGIYGLVVAYLIGWAAQALIQIPDLKRADFHFHPNFSLNTPEMKQVFTLMAPVMISTWVQPINLTINTRYASYLHQGAGVSMIEIATNLYLILAGVFILSITNVIFPRLAKLTAQGEEDKFQSTLRQTLHVSLFFTLPMSVGLAVVSEPLVAFLYGGGEFDANSITYTAQALACIAFGMNGYGVQNMISRAYFAKEQGKTPLIMGCIAIFTNLILCHLLVDPLGITGLALASSCSGNLYGLLLLLALHKEEGGLLTPDFGKDVGKMLLLSGLMFVVTKEVLVLTLPFGNVIALGATAMIGLICYLILALLVDLEEMSFLRQKIFPST